MTIAERTGISEEKNDENTDLLHWNNGYINKVLNFVHETEWGGDSDGSKLAFLFMLKHECSIMLIGMRF